MLLSVIDWTQIILAGIAAVVTMANGLGIALVYSHLRTPSRRSIGKQVEDTNHTAIANNYRLQSLSGELGVPMPEKAAQEEARVEELNTIRSPGVERKSG